MFTIELQGLEGFKLMVASFQWKVIEEIRALIVSTAMQGQADARDYCPVKTGNLKRSIQWRLEPGSDGFTGSVYTGCSYSIFVEFGTRKQRAQPYMWPAYVMLRENFDKGLRAIAARIR